MVVNNFDKLKFKTVCKFIKKNQQNIKNSQLKYCNLFLNRTHIINSNK